MFHCRRPTSTFQGYALLNFRVWLRSWYLIPAQVLPRIINEFVAAWKPREIRWYNDVSKTMSTSSFARVTVPRFACCSYRTISKFFDLATFYQKDKIFNFKLSLSLSLTHTHTHTHVYIHVHIIHLHVHINYIYIYIYIYAWGFVYCADVFRLQAFVWMQKHFIKIILFLWKIIIIFTNPSARAGYDTRSIFKRILTGLNSEFSFS